MLLRGEGEVTLTGLYISCHAILQGVAGANLMTMNRPLGYQHPKVASLDNRIRPWETQDLGLWENWSRRSPSDHVLFIL